MTTPASVPLVDAAGRVARPEDPPRFLYRGVVHYAAGRPDGGYIAATPENACPEYVWAGHETLRDDPAADEHWIERRPTNVWERVTDAGQSLLSRPAPDTSTSAVTAPAITAEFDVDTNETAAQTAVDTVRRALTGPTEDILQRYNIVVGEIRIVPLMWTGTGETPPARVEAVLRVHPTNGSADLVDDAMRAVAAALAAEQVTYRGVR